MCPHVPLAWQRDTAKFAEVTTSFVQFCNFDASVKNILTFKVDAISVFERQNLLLQVALFQALCWSWAPLNEVELRGEVDTIKTKMLFKRQFTSLAHEPQTRTTTNYEIFMTNAWQENAIALHKRFSPACVPYLSCTTLVPWGDCLLLTAWFDRRGFSESAEECSSWKVPHKNGPFPFSVLPFCSCPKDQTVESSAFAQRISDVSTSWRTRNWLHGVSNIAIKGNTSKKHAIALFVIRFASTKIVRNTKEQKSHSSNVPQIWDQYFVQTANTETSISFLELSCCV